MKILCPRGGFEFYHIVGQEVMDGGGRVGSVLEASDAFHALVLDGFVHTGTDYMHLPQMVRRGDQVQRIPEFRMRGICSLLVVH